MTDVIDAFPPRFYLGRDGNAGAESGNSSNEKEAGTASWTRSVAGDPARGTTRIPGAECLDRIPILWFRALLRERRSDPALLASGGDRRLASDCQRDESQVLRDHQAFSASALRGDAVADLVPRDVVAPAQILLQLVMPGGNCFRRAVEVRKKAHRAKLAASALARSSTA